MTRVPSGVGSVGLQCDVSLRVAVGSDAPVVAALVCSLLQELSSAAVDAGAVADVTRAVLGSGRVTAVLAFQDGQPIGVMTLDDCMAIYAGGRFGEISELYVVPSQRSRGVAQSLVRFAMDVGRERGWRRVEVCAPAQPEWERTTGFYLANGFQEVGPRLRRIL